MSEETTETTEATEAVEESQAQAEIIETDWKAEARKWEARAKAAKADSEAAAKWRDYEKSLKPEQERLAEELAQIKAEASEATAKLLRYEVATQKGIPSDAIELLNGSDRDELEKAADKLLSLIANQSKTPIKADVNQGKPNHGGTSTADQFASALGELL
jgi:uncharacterized phage infection (PIP) family protein YhgE